MLCNNGAADKDQMRAVGSSKPRRVFLGELKVPGALDWQRLPGCERLAAFPDHRTARETIKMSKNASVSVTGRIHPEERQAQSGDGPIAPALRRPEDDEDYLILTGLDDFQ